MLLSATAETGVDGAQLTAGTDFDIVNNGTNGSHVYSASGKIQGTKAYKSTTGTTVTYVGWSTSLGGAKTELWMRLYGNVPAYYAGSLFQLRHAGATAGRISLTLAGKVKIDNGAGTTIATSTNIFALGTPFRVEAHAIASASPTGGTLEVRIYASKDSSVATETLGPFTTTQTAADFDQVWFGPYGTGTAGNILYHDDDAVTDVGWLGPTGTPIVPAKLSNNADGANGVAVTSGSSGGPLGNPLDVEVLNGSSTATFDATTFAHGSASIKIISGGVNAYVGWSAGVMGSQSDLYARIYIKMSAYPSAGAAVIRFFSGGSQCAGINVTSTGTMRLRDASNTNVATGVSIIPLNTWVRIEAHVTPSTTAGLITSRLYSSADSGIVTETLNATNQVLTAVIDNIGFGMVGGATGNTMWIDELATDNSGWIGAVATRAKRWGFGMVASPGLLNTSPTQPPNDTIFGMNCALSSGAGASHVGYAERLAWFGRVPCGRGWYNPGQFPSNGGNFTSGGKEWGHSGGTGSEKRANIIFQFPDTDQAHQVAIGNHDTELINYITSVPSDWTVFFTFYSEYSGHFSASNPVEDFIAAFVHIGALCAQYSPGGQVRPTINGASSGWSSSYAPPANQMPDNTVMTLDAYGNPNGQPTGYKNYGTKIPSVTSIIDPIYNSLVNTLGYQNWGIGEFGAPQRVAPALSTLDATLGWGPLSPHDISGAQRAQWITDYCNYMLSRPVPPTLVQIFESDLQTGNWQQSFVFGGDDAYDDGTAGNPGPNYQGWPINISPTNMINAYKAFINTSP